MNQLNSLILEGNLVRDAVLTQPAEGFKKLSFSVGVNRFYKNRNNEDVDEVSFFDVEAYGKMAEYNVEKAIKGRGIRIVGRLKQDTWKDANGKTASRIYVVAEHIEYKPVKKVDTSAEEKAQVPLAQETPVKEQAEEAQVQEQAQPQQEMQPEPVAVTEEAVF